MIDDALSAVDAHVAKHLFNQCIVDELLTSTNGKKRSVILVTNALQFLSHPRVNRIVVVNDGRIAEQGSYQELAGQPDSLFARFLHVIEETGIKSAPGDDDSVDDEPEDRRRARSRLGSEDLEASARSSVTTTGSERPTKKITIMTKEARSIGHVSMDVYMAWAKAAGGLWVPFVLVALFGSVEGMNVLAKWYLTYWSSHATSDTQMGYLETYALINFGFICCTFCAMILLVWIGMKASQNVSDRPPRLCQLQCKIRISQ